MPPVVLRPQAEQDIIQAQRWYEARSPGLGLAFVSAVDDTIQRILNQPLAFPEVHGPTRRAIIRRFPYGVYFRELPEHIVVLAVMHGSRHPRRWQARH
ncbi:MAG: type II toxin-antitoxin system RelE/ParE family toxin [Candidatus Latescibacteria bacterium]|nr:type II toxin-antitoxin system RelE/ParE family toxin [Candidatus Latescibacterota bacterium]MDP7449360.1 type II toxin-antitoxin system RelE/ParE family toxin [Candidatus Latescibacterota bacterium]HJP32914.1 type II toxin-antitoxin system RelE/ParE family toxin [Candidatus Latescibacterota bacterium]